MTKLSRAKSSSTAPSMSARRSSHRTGDSAEAGAAPQCPPRIWRASSTCLPTAVSSTSTAASRSWRHAGIPFLLVVVLFTSACANRAAERRARADRHLAVAKVFESTTPYSARTVTQAELDAFLSKAVEYRADSASIANFYRDRHLQFAWILGDSISASAEAFVALAGV